MLAICMHCMATRNIFSFKVHVLILSNKSSREDMCGLRTSFLLKLSCEQICLCPQYSKSGQTGSGHAADSKMRYTMQFSILMLCAKYQEAGLSGSREKCDRNFCDAGDTRRRIVIPICRLY